ncbi:MAG: hypothetical protein H0W66_06200 [Chthoniobacterales bacterium]|nr:hypothetical protein [Chthoniobacterales bacterium]
MAGRERDRSPSPFTTHLAPGGPGPSPPRRACILSAYEAGTITQEQSRHGLLGESLRQLRAAGLYRATAFTKGNAPVAKFLYPKFNGVLTPGDTPLLAA